MKHRAPGPRVWVAACLWSWGAWAAAQAPLPGPTAAAMSQDASQQAQTTGMLHGSITDALGTPIAGAAVTVTFASGLAPLLLRSDMDGRFAAGNVPAGAATVLVTFQGFDAASQPVTVVAGQDAEVSALVLHMSEVRIAVDAVVPTEELAAEQIRVEEHQRLLGFAPNFFVSYEAHAAPLTTRQKYQLAWKNTIDPGNLLLVGALSGFQQATDEFNGYGQGAAGYGRRYGANLGNLVAGTYMGGAVLPSLFHQDPRYFYQGTGTVKSRLWHAVSSAVICRGDNGKRQFAWASVLGDLSAGAISNAYYAPEDRQGAALTFENGFLGVAGDALNGVVQEFFLKKFTTNSKHKP